MKKVFKDFKKYQFIGQKFKRKEKKQLRRISSVLWSRFWEENPSCSREPAWLLVSVGIVLVPASRQVPPVRGVYWCCSNKWCYLLSTRSLHSQHSHRQDRKHNTRFISEHCAGHCTLHTINNSQWRRSKCSSYPRPPTDTS